MIALAIIGMIVLVCIGVIAGIATLQMAVFSLGFTGKLGPELLPSGLMSVVCFALALWLNPFTVSISAGVAP